MRSFSHVTLIVIASLTVWCSLLTQAAPAQTFTVVHEFSGGRDGASPVGGLAMDRAGNSYGSTLVGGGGPCSFNGTTGCGAIFALKRSGSGWTVSPLYDFAGGNDGYGPGPLVIGTNGSLYGATSGGGGLGDCAENGCGTVYNVKPPAASCKTALCLWNESILYRFAGSDGAGPNAPLIFDSAGELYGSTYLGGAHNGGTVFRLTPSSGLWSESLLYSFTGGNDGYLPSSGLTFDRTGNLYGTTYYGGTGIYGTVFELTPSGSGWTESVLHNFQAQSDGGDPNGDVIFDAAGDIYGATSGGFATVFELTPAGSNWLFNVLYSFGALGGPSNGSVVMDAAGNLYGTTARAGASLNGSVYKLTRSGGGWIYTDLHDFCQNGPTCPDGCDPQGNIAIDNNGNLFGAAGTGTSDGSGCKGNGLIWEITP